MEDNEDYGKQFEICKNAVLVHVRKIISRICDLFFKCILSFHSRETVWYMSNCKSSSPASKRTSTTP
jgi:hypothetical protein